MKKLGVCGESSNKLGYKMFIDYPPVDELESPALLDHFPLLKKKKIIGNWGFFYYLFFNIGSKNIYILIDSLQNNDHSVLESFQ